MGATWDEVWSKLDGSHGPVAATLPDAADLLGATLAATLAAARTVEPYRHADGSPRWSVGELAARLGLAERDRNGYRLGWRSGDRDGRGRRHARRGAAVTNGRRAPTVEDLAAVEDLGQLDPLDDAGVEDLPAAASEQ